MPYVNVPNDLSKIKTKIAFNLTKRQLICFGMGAAIGVPTYLLTRQAIGNTVALFAMLTIMLPAFLLAMYEKDGLPFEKVIRNIVRVKFGWAGHRDRPGQPAPHFAYGLANEYQRRGQSAFHEGGFSAVPM